MKVFVTGGAGFIGSALIRNLLENTACSVLNFDKLTYAGNLESLPGVVGHDRYHFVQGDICDRDLVGSHFSAFQPDAVVHLAAESHVDRSIEGPEAFISTNVTGTFTLLECARSYLSQRDNEKRERFRFHHVSTDEVYGDLQGTEALFTEDSSYKPSSPYSATKAASDHLVRAWTRTYGLPVLITNCSNNYGPYQFPEKLIPHMILSALAGKPLPVYGDGSQIRDWLYVTDHAEALWRVLRDGKPGSTYNIGGHNEASNLSVVQTICSLLGDLVPGANPSDFLSLVTHVTDRPGHDYRYAIDASKIEQELGWRPLETFETGLRKTVQWYLDNQTWWSNVLDGSYKLERAGS